VRLLTSHKVLWSKAFSTCNDIFKRLIKSRKKKKSGNSKYQLDIYKEINIS
jgi:hypothetical protein